MESNQGSTGQNPKEISKEELKDILSEHQLWTDSEGTKGKAANLNKRFLKGAVLIGANLEKANLKTPTSTVLI